MWKRIEGMMGLDPGSLLFNAVRGESIIIMGPSRRCGHQYDRHEEYEVYITQAGSGKLKWYDEYDLYRILSEMSVDKAFLKLEEENNDG